MTRIRKTDSLGIGVLQTALDKMLVAHSAAA
jgi:hypothetical protein